MFSTAFYILGRQNAALCVNGLTLSKMTNCRLFHTEFADENFRFDGNGGKFCKRVEDSGKRKICWLRVISPFPTVSLKDLHCRFLKNRACLGKG